MRIVIDIPNKLMLRKDKIKKDEIKKAAIVKLYELGRISSGQAAKLLGISRIDFLNLLGDYKVQIFPDSEEELIKDIKNA